MADEWEGIEKPITHTPRMARGTLTKYVPNHRSFGLFIKSDQVRHPVAQVAQDIALLAAANTGAGGGEHSRGLHDRVRKGFRVKRNAGLMKVAGNLRVKVEVFNNVEGSALLEFGARNLPRERMLGRAGAAFGDFKPEGGPK